MNNETIMDLRKRISDIAAYYADTDTSTDKYLTTALQYNVWHLDEYPNQQLIDKCYHNANALLAVLECNSGSPELISKVDTLTTILSNLKAGDK